MGFGLESQDVKTGGVSSIMEVSAALLIKVALALCHMIQGRQNWIFSLFALILDYIFYLQL